VFVTLEGPDGGGKTTQAGRLVQRLKDSGYDALGIHEPGGTELGQHVRGILVGRSWTGLDPWAEALLFSACRAQLVKEVIRPALERGAIVVADRFADSTLAYQGAGRGLEVERLALLIDLATGGLTPDVTVLLDIEAHVGIERNRLPAEELGRDPPSAEAQMTFFEEMQLPAAWNRFETEAIAFHERVRAAYLELAKAEPQRWVIVDAAAPVDEVSVAVWDALEARF
jgi:dTMP kinase